MRSMISKLIFSIKSVKKMLLKLWQTTTGEEILLILFLKKNKIVLLYFSCCIYNSIMGVVG